MNRKTKGKGYWLFLTAGVAAVALIAIIDAVAIGWEQANGR